jgi:hypothetical protein
MAETTPLQKLEAEITEAVENYCVLHAPENLYQPIEKVDIKALGA